MTASARIWLADLTYTQQTISSDVMPAAIGCIAAYALKHLSGEVEARVFKFPESLAAALESELPPHVIGFSNYVWNRDLSAEFARVIKKHRPKVVTVMGGPNYPTTRMEQEEFVRRHPMVDFFIIKEGEIAFAKLVDALRQVEFDPARVPDDLPSVHRILPDGRFSTSEVVERITDLAEIPSPYLSGLLDQYFDGRMLPIIQTNRGCPFRCTFCVEGMDYYSRVAKTRNLKIHDELAFIARRMAGLHQQGKGRSDLHIADSNFGMYKEDLEVCQTIAVLQKEFGYPEYISVATGKNHKERVLEAARLLNGALRLSGSVQSLDKTVLANIDRTNISEREIMELAFAGSRIGANTYSEIILALPGDTRESHFRSIRTIVEADFNTLCLYQLMLLPGTDLASRESIRKWGMKTQYRVLPRCFGSYELFGEDINAAEIEEICISNNSLTFQDYLDCRRMHLVVNVFYNDGVFKEVLRLLTSLGLSKYDWLDRIFQFRDNRRFNDLVEAFLKETGQELSASESDLRRFVRDRKNIVRYIKGELGANLIFKYRSLALIEHIPDLAKVAAETLTAYLSEADASEDALKLGRELIEYSRLRMTNIFVNLDEASTGTFEYDIASFARETATRPLTCYRRSRPVEYRFALSEAQKKTMAEYLSVYGGSLMGLSRILTKLYVRRAFRSAEVTDDKSPVPILTAREIAIGQGQLTGLNEFS